MSTSTFQIQQSGPTAAVVQPPSVQAQRHDARTLVLLEAPIAATLVKLAAPNILVNIVRSAVGLIETYFVGKLGTDALAGVALVFPVVMLTLHSLHPGVRVAEAPAQSPRIQRKHWAREVEKP